MTIWGTIWDFLNEAGDGFYYKVGSLEQIRRETWASYVSGVDALEYFDWAPQNNDSYSWRWGQDRNDTAGRRLFAYIGNLAGQLQELPVLDSRPEVLVIGNGYQTGEAMSHVDHLRLFTEYDLVNQRCFAKTDVDLSKYSLVLVTDRWHRNETVRKLDEYVANGGNVLFLGGIGDEPGPDEPRARYDIESNTTEFTISEHALLNISSPNPLNLDMVLDAPYYVSAFLNGTHLSTNHVPFGQTVLFTANGTPHPTNDSSLLLYHDISSPGSGWVLYCGAIHLSSDASTTDETYDYQSEHELRSFYRTVVRAFARFLNITNSISTNVTENMLITQGKVDDHTLMAGICNFNNETRSFNYTVDLGKFGLSDGLYYVHSLDANCSLGSFQSTSGTLSFGLTVVTNGTRLLLISTEPPAPNYSIDIFPQLPHVAEESTTQNVSSPVIVQWDLLPVTIAVSGVSSVMALVLYLRRKNNRP